MYARRFYRKTPPGYSGVLFAPTKEEAFSISEEDKTLALGQKEWHQGDTRRRAPLNKGFIGYLLAPLYREDAVPVISASDGGDGDAAREAAAVLEKTGIEKDEVKKQSDLYDELTLIGALLFLMGTGLDSESVLVLLAVLILLT